MRASTLLALLAISVSIPAAPAVAQDRNSPPHAALTTCGERKEVASYLRQTFDEVPVSYGLQRDGRMVQIFASERSGTWTIVATTPDGVSCIMAAGEAWQILPTGPLA